MRWRVELTSLAKRDISQVLEWTRTHFGERQHDRYRNMIRATIQQIASDPSGFRGKLRPDLGDNVRCMRIGMRGKKSRHQLFYRIHEDGLIVIGRLLHDAMDPESNVSDEFKSNN